MALPAVVAGDELRASVTRGLPVPGFDPNTGLQDLPPIVEAGVSGADVGISLWAPRDRDCLLGARIGGKVSVGRPSRTRMQPGELSCHPSTAISLFGATRTP